MRLVARLLVCSCLVGCMNVCAKTISVYLFVRTDCPITNRYAPEMTRIAKEFAGKPVSFFLVYPDKTETAASIQRHVADYHLPGQILRGPQHELERKAHVTIAPEAAVFDGSGQLRYHGRIDDLYVSVGRSRPGGALTHDLEDSIRELLAGKPVRVSETQAFGCSLADIE